MIVTVTSTSSCSTRLKGGLNDNERLGTTKGSDLQIQICKYNGCIGLWIDSPRLDPTASRVRTKWHPSDLIPGMRIVSTNKASKTISAPRKSASFQLRIIPTHNFAYLPSILTSSDRSLTLLKLNTRVNGHSSLCQKLTRF